MKRGDNGYTLVEVLVALTIIAFVVGGLVEGSRLISRVGAASARDVRASRDGVEARRALERLFASAGPFRSDDHGGLSGDAKDLSFDCGHSAPCGARLVRDGDAARLVVQGPGWSTTAPLAAARDLTFSYATTTGVETAWPPVVGDDAKPVALRSVSVVKPAFEGDAPVATARLFIDQRPDCRYDPISRVCREADQ